MLRRRFLVVVLVALATGAGSGVPPGESAAPPNDGAALLRVASKLSGLRPKRPVTLVREPLSRFQGRRIANAAGYYPAAVRAYDETLYRALGLTAGRGTLSATLVTTDRRPALYDPAKSRVYAPTVKQSDRRGVLEAYVTALQDQHFAVGRRARSLVGSRDAAFGARGAISGYSTLVGARLDPATRRPQTVMPKLARFLALESAFSTTVGLRLAADLRNLGGNQAVFSALARFPQSTEQVFHLDKLLERERPVPIVLPVDAAGLTLIGDDTFGELDVRALLATFGVPGIARVGSGWGGGRTGVYRAGDAEAVLVALDWDTEADALEWQAAVGAYVTRAFPAARPAECAAKACWAGDGAGFAFELTGARTALVLGGGAAPTAALARAVLGLG